MPSGRVFIVDKKRGYNMKEVKDTGQKPSKKPLIYYYIVMLVIVMLLNALLFPSMMRKQVIEVPYNEFLNMVDEGTVTEVALEEEDGQLVFIAGEGDSQQVYKTGISVSYTHLDVYKRQVPSRALVFERRPPRYR